jgi:hypothetical protein
MVACEQLATEIFDEFVNQAVATLLGVIICAMAKRPAAKLCSSPKGRGVNA